MRRAIVTNVNPIRSSISGGKGLLNDLDSSIERLQGDSGGQDISSQFGSLTEQAAKRAATRILFQPDPASPSNLNRLETIPTSLKYCLASVNLINQH